jgi:hypothetical protein
MKDARTCPKACYYFASGVNEKIVVEITNRTGIRAYKEYDTPSVDTAIEAASRALRANRATGGR